MFERLWRQWCHLAVMHGHASDSKKFMIMISRNQLYQTEMYAQAGGSGVKKNFHHLRFQLMYTNKKKSFRSTLWLKGMVFSIYLEKSGALPTA